MSISELMRPAPSPAVESWMSAQPAAGMFISAITEAELRYGLALLPDGHRQRRLLAQAEAMLAEDFAGGILPGQRCSRGLCADRRSPAPRRPPNLAGRRPGLPGRSRRRAALYLGTTERGGFRRMRHLQ